MIPVLSRSQMRAFDAHAIGVANVPSLVLMENAGRGAAEHIEGLLGERSDAAIVIVCGTGNNGGDGFVVARHLLAEPRSLEVYLCGDPARLTPDARVNHDAFVALGGVVRSLANQANLKALRTALTFAVVAVDALFGTGLDRPIEGLAADAVVAMNESSATRVALDVPSGMNADTGVALGPTFKADITVTFGHLKLGLLTSRGAVHAGEILVVGIGVPGDVPSTVGSSADLLERADVTTWLCARPIDTHKYSAGHVAVLSGSPGKIGASLLVARGVLRAGAGAATIATWSEAAASIESRVLEVMCARIDRNDIANTLDAALAHKRAVVLGPGFGLDESARHAVEHVLSTWTGPLVLDADALTLVARDLSLVGRSPSARVLTPHSGELARLLGSTSDAVEADRFGAAQALSTRTRSVVVLKGARTIVARPEGRMVINGGGTPALATAGSGDVLAGIIGALLCSLDAFEAACAGVYLHAAVAELWSKTHADRGLLASEIADLVPTIFGELLRERRR